MVVHAHGPERLARLGVHGVHVRPEVSKVRRVAVLRPGHRSHADGSHDCFPGLGGPVHAAGPRIERVHHPVVAAHEHPTAGHRRLAPDRAAVWKAERPLAPQPRHLLDRQPRGSGRLKASARGGIGAHAVPLWPDRRIAHRHATPAPVRHRRSGAVCHVSEGPTGQVLGKPALVLLREGARIGRHRAGRQRLEHSLRGERPEGLATDRVGDETGRSMADRAPLLEHHVASCVRHPLGCPGAQTPAPRRGRHR